ncbi:keratin-associated protein 8-1 [Pseudorca crassidens]|uniref:keratin-associated protein 8-1 n=1 Tax=Pseudorca crassidens TaxID=82174 RepID=UPI00352DC16D
MERRESIILRKRIPLLSRPPTPDTMCYNNFSSTVFPGCYWGSYSYPLGYSVGCGYVSTHSPVGYGFGYGYNGCGAFDYRRFWPSALY